MLGRRGFLLSLSAGTVSFSLLNPNRLLASQDGPKPVDLDLVKGFVGKSHGDLSSVQEMLETEPRLVFASWDWGNGDWETGLGAASHVGRRDIAEFLIGEGARVDAFAAAMLGMTELTQSFLSAIPKTHAVPGPHGIPLLAHAIYGREPAAEVFELLLDSGADVNGASYGGNTCLMSAASIGHTDALKELLKRGADKSLTDNSGQTALDWAKKREQEEAIAILSAE